MEEHKPEQKQEDQKVIDTVEDKESSGETKSTAELTANQLKKLKQKQKKALVKQQQQQDTEKSEESSATNSTVTEENNNSETKAETNQSADDEFTKELQWCLKQLYVGMEKNQLSKEQSNKLQAKKIIVML